MTSLDELLAAAAASTVTPSLTDLLRELSPADPATAIRESAAGALGHLTCRAAVQALAVGEPPDSAATEALLAGISSQRSLLTLNDSVDGLLESGEFVAQFGQPLCDALLRGHAETLDTKPILAAGFLEGALRLAIVDAARPIRVLGALELDDIAHVSVEYAERLPRLIGAALDRWGMEEALVSTLRQDLDGLEPFQMRPPTPRSNTGWISCAALATQTRPAPSRC